MKAKIVVYKAVFRPPEDTIYDRLYPVECHAPDVRFVIFRDVPEPTMEAGWEVLPQQFHDHDRRRRARHHKCCPHELFDAEYTLWLDGSFTPKAHPADLLPHLGRDLVAALPHVARCCAYAEGQRMAEKGRDEPSIIHAQMRRMRADGFPERQGLHATGALLRANHERVHRFNELWWEEITRGSNRDQVSFNYCLWKLKLPIVSLPGRWKKNPFLTWRPHYH